MVTLYVYSQYSYHGIHKTVVSVVVLLIVTISHTRVCMYTMSMFACFMYIVIYYEGLSYTVMSITHSTFVGICN